MTATTYTHIPGARTSGSFGGWLSRIFWRIAEAREKQARERVARHFRGYNDAYLEKLGYAPADIRRIRQG
jgi:hypothetical protein